MRAICFYSSYSASVLYAAIHLFVGIMYIKMGNFFPVSSGSTILFYFVSIALILSIFTNKKIKCIILIGNSIFLLLFSLDGFSDLFSFRGLLITQSNIYSFILLLSLLFISLAGITSASLILRSEQKIQ